LDDVALPERALMLFDARQRSTPLALEERRGADGGLSRDPSTAHSFRLRQDRNACGGR